MSKEHPKVSVIIPTYNRGGYIKRALESVLNQTYNDFEIIIVDDGSTDDTKKVLEPYKDVIKYIYQENKGVSAARNRGIKGSCGEYIAFLDSDDGWTNEKLSIQSTILDKDKKIGIVYSKMTKINAKNEVCGTKPENYIGKDFNELIEKGGDLPTSAVMVRRECFDQAGLFDETFEIMEDLDMWIRIAQDHVLFQVTEPNLALYYVHEGQVTQNRIKAQYAKVQLDQKILRTYKNIAKGIVQKRLSANEYTLSRAFYMQKKYSGSFDHLCAAFKLDPLVGTSFIVPKDNIFVMIFKFFKPYLFFIVCSMRSLLKKQGS